MKKINLKGISEILSEKELKNVMGGKWSNFKCSNGQEGLCMSDNGCLDEIVSLCPGGWIQW
jgi:natural product precursor